MFSPTLYLGILVFLRQNTQKTVCEKCASKVGFMQVFSYQVPIRVHEVQEVMRRVHNPQAGKLNFGGPIPETHFLLAL